MNIEDLSNIELDNLWISIFDEPYRDAEMLLWDNLKWDLETKTIIDL